MASPEDIAKLRLLIGEPDDSNGWTDEKLADIIDASSSLNDAASKVWVSKAGTYSSLVDVSESGSSRKLSDMHRNALTMAEYFKDAEEASVPAPTSYPVIQRIRRGFS